MYILLGSVVIDILLTLTGQCSHTMLIIGTSPLISIIHHREDSLYIAWSSLRRKPV